MIGGAINPLSVAAAAAAYLTKTSAAATYLTQANAASTYETQAAAALLSPPLMSSTAPANAKIETMPRAIMSAQNVAIGATTGTVYMCAVEVAANIPINNIGFIPGTTAAGTPTHWWLGFADSGGVQRAHTADQLTAAIATGPGILLPVVTQYVTPSAGVYYFLISVTATTNPTISGHAAVVGSSQVAPVLAGVSSSPAQSTPGTDGTTTYNLPATADVGLGYFWAT